MVKQFAILALDFDAAPLTLALIALRRSALPLRVDIELTTIKLFAPGGKKRKVNAFATRRAPSAPGSHASAAAKIRRSHQAGSGGGATIECI